jgi:hypothetical protein
MEIDLNKKNIDCENELKKIPENANKLGKLMAKKLNGEKLSVQEEQDYNNLLYYFGHP